MSIGTTWLSVTIQLYYCTLVHSLIWRFNFKYYDLESNILHSCQFKLSWSLKLDAILLFKCLDSTKCKVLELKDLGQLCSRVKEPDKLTISRALEQVARSQADERERNDFTTPPTESHLLFLMSLPKNALFNIKISW